MNKKIKYIWQERGAVLGWVFLILFFGGIVYSAFNPDFLEDPPPRAYEEFKDKQSHDRTKGVIDAATREVLNR